MEKIKVCIFTDGFNDLEESLFYEIRNDDNIFLISKNNCFKNRLIQKLFRVHLSHRINNRLNTPFKSIWYKYLDPLRGKDCGGRVLYLFFPSWYYPEFFKYLRKKHSKSKLALFFGDTVASKKKNIKSLSIHKAKKIVDGIYSYNPNDVSYYGISHQQMCYSRYPQFIYEDGKLDYDIVFFGASRGRYEKICTIYRILKKQGLRVFFYIVDHQKDEINNDDFVITNKIKPLKTYLSYVRRSKCILEILDTETSGYTLRFWDAIMYDKYLITNNANVVDSKFYNPKYINVFKDIEDIDTSFLTTEGMPQFNYNGENSPKQFVEKIIDDLFSK